MEQVFAEMRKTKRLRLGKTHTVLHYFFGFVLMGIPLLAFIFLYHDIRSGEKSTFFYITLISVGLGYLYFFRQYRSLNFKVIPVRVTEQEFREIFDELSKKMHWIHEHSGSGYIVATTEFRWINWGTMITLVRDEDTLMINSICDLYKRPSTTAWGQNRRNYAAFMQYVSDRFPTADKNIND
jgi:hypothetical protein